MNREGWCSCTAAGSLAARRAAVRLAHDRASSVDRLDQCAAGVGPGAGFFEAVFDRAARRFERGVEFVAGIAFGDF